MTHTQTQGAEGAGTKTAGAMILLPLDDPKRSLNDSGLPSAMIWAGGEAYDDLTADKALDLDSCALAVGIYRAMTEAHAKEIATLSPAPAATSDVRSLLRTARSGLATYGAGAFEGTILQIDAILAHDPISPAPAATSDVPDSVREALLLARAALNAATDALDGAAKREKVPDRSLKLLSTSQDCEHAASVVRALIAAQPAGQAGEVQPSENSEPPILRALVGVYQDRTETRLTFGDRIRPEPSVKAVEQAIAALTAEYEARGGCPVVGRHPAGQAGDAGADLFEASRRLIVEWGNAPELPEEMENALTRFERVWLAGDAGEDARTVLTEACKPWEHYTGEPPDDGSPLSGVFVAGMVYTERLLAKLLDVTHYEGGDGSEDFDNDATQTLRNILTGAGLWDADENRAVKPAPDSTRTGEEGTEALEALRGIADDYMTSESHHPGYVLIPVEKFDRLRTAAEALPPKPHCGAYPECGCRTEGKCEVETAPDCIRTGDEGTEAIDRAIVSALNAVDIVEEAESYEFRPDVGCHTPTEFEKVLLIDFAQGLMNAVHQAVRPLCLAARPEAPSDAGWRERVRHVKRGTEYEVLHRGVELQVATPSAAYGAEYVLPDGAALVIYQGEDGNLWAREDSEFDDGRFVSAPVSDPAPSGQAEG